MITFKFLIVISSLLISSLGVSQLNNIYGLSTPVSGVFLFSKYDQATQNITVLSSTSVGSNSIVTGGGSTIDPVNNIYYFKAGNGNLVGVDISNGNTVQSVYAPNFRAIAYNCSDSVIYGLSNPVSGVFLFSKYDQTTQNVIVISSTLVGSNSILTGGYSTIDPANNIYYFKAGNGNLVGVDISNGNTVQSIYAPDFRAIALSYSCSKNFIVNSNPKDFIDKNIVIPNIFTPNNDFLNDFFHIKNFDIHAKTSNIIIFNRWGNIVYQSSLPNFKWEGEHQGSKCPDGTYFYILNYNDFSNENISINGSLALLR
jgi:gliding motility-associated-like protein